MNGFDAASLAAHAVGSGPQSRDIITTIRTETIANENLEIFFHFRFRNEMTTKFPPDFLLHLLS